MQYTLIGPGYELHRDEYLHLDQARHLAWGYESVPPFTSWISWLILQLGNSVYWVKFFPALFGALTILFTWKIIKALNGNLFALILGATAMTFSVLPRIHLLYQPNSFDILCWTFIYHTLVSFIKTKNNKWLYYAAIGISFGLLNKYNIIFLIAGLLPALLMTDTRKLFLNKHFYFALALTLLLISPNLVWQFQHDFPVIKHLNELAARQLVNVQRGAFAKEQFLFFFNSVFLLILGFISFFSYPDFKKYRMIFWSYVFTIMIFLYFRAKGYYAIGLYPVILAFGAVYMERISSTGWKKWLRPAAILLQLLLFIPAIKLLFPLSAPETIARNAQKSGMHRWEDGKEYLLPQDFADMLGWRELAAKTDSAYNSINDKEYTLVLCDNYGQAGAINYYTTQNIRAVSMNADYINWFELGQPIKNVILIREKDNKDIAKEKQLFTSVKQVGSIENSYAREKGTEIYILSSPTTDINKLLAEEIKNRKAY